MEANEGIGGYPVRPLASPHPAAESEQSAMPSYQTGPPSGQKRAHLYVGNLDSRVTEYMLQKVFDVAGAVLGVKIIPDRNFQHGGQNYGFVEYREIRAAENAIQTLNGRKIFDSEIRVNWAYQNNQPKEDLTNHFHVFVGDLSPEVNDDVLKKTFAAFPTVSDARVMWDMNTGKSRGYGFLAFRDRNDAEQAIATMNGEWLGSRAIRVNWANQKTGGLAGGGGPSFTGGAPDMINGQHAMPAMLQLTPAQGPGYGQPQPQQGPPQFVTPGGASYEVVVQQTPAYNTTVYVGNLVPYATQNDLLPLFQSFGYVVDVRMQADRGFAFVKLDTHENAAMAIVNLQGQPLHGRNIKCSWGKDQQGAAAAAQGGAVSHAPATAAVPGIPQGLDFSSSPYGPPDANALAYAQQWANGDPNLIVQYAIYYQQQAAQYYATVQAQQQPSA